MAFYPSSLDGGFFVNSGENRFIDESDKLSCKVQRLQMSKAFPYEGFSL